MTGHTEVYLEDHRTRVVGDLDATPAREAAPSISLEPREPGVSVGGGGPETGGTIRLRNRADSETVARFTGAGGDGSLELATSSGARAVTLDTDPTAPRVEVGDGTAPTTRLDAGSVKVLRTTAAEPPVVEAAADGELALSNGTGQTTIRFRGPDASLELQGTPEHIPRSDPASAGARFGGGELVVASQATPADDIHIHAKGEEDSDYGVEDNNRPRILLDGVTATLEVGRHAIDSDRPAVAGRVRFRDRHRGAALLDLEAQFTITSDFTVRQFGEVRFKEWDAPKVRQRGRVLAHPQGLMFYDAGDNPAMLLTPNGDLLTRHSPTTNTSL